MRMGAIFARGSCTALKWVALFGVVFALGAADAFAQAQATVKIELGTAKPMEGGALVPVTVTVTPTADATVPGNATVTLTLAPDGATAGTPDDMRGELDTADADVAWEGVARGTAAAEPLEFNWGDSRQADSETINLRTYRDTDAENEKFTITSATTGATEVAVVTVKFEVQDAETQTFVLRHPFNNDGEIDEGTAGTMLELEAVPLKTGPVNMRVTLHSANDGLEDYSLATGTASISELFLIPQAGETSAGVVQVPFVTEANDGDRIDDTVTFEVTYADGDMRGDAAMEEFYTLTIVDQHKLPYVSLDGITIVVDKKDTAVTMLMEGQVGTLTLEADRGKEMDGTSSDDVTSEAITITLSHADSSSADRQDYRLGGSPVSIDAGTLPGKGEFTLDVLADEDVGQEMLTLVAEVKGATKANGEETYDAMIGPITFVDNTMKKIEAKSYDDVKKALADAREKGAGSNGMWNPGEMMTLMASDMFMWPETTTSVVLGNVVVDDMSVLSASTSNDMLTLTAMGPGETPVSVTATVVTESSSFEVTQTVSNVATIKFPVMVDAHMITAMSDADVQAAFDAAVAEAAADNPRMAWEPGGAEASVSLDDLFDVPESITASYLAESSDPDDVMVEVHGDHVALMPMSAGMAEITVTAVDTAEGMAATVMANVMVMAIDAADITYMLSGPEDMNLAEGMSAMLTVMASDPVPMDTEIMIMRDRAASSADEDDYMAEAVMIEAGMMMGTTMVMAVEDNMAEDMEELVLFAMAGDMMVEGEVKLYLWDAAVPALPIIAQLLLAGILGIGGYRRYLRR